MSDSQAESMPSNIGPYRIVRKLGEGGMGVVYEAIHETIARRVAIKVLHPDYAVMSGAVDRFFNEARAVNLIEHPSLVQVSDFGTQPDKSAYLVMELLRGESLTARRRHGAITVQTILQIAWQIADGLVAAHGKGIVHRDLKPDNIMLIPEALAPGGERVKILDFGIAKLAQGGSTKTQSNVIMGTPAYMSPEQCRGAGTVDAKADVYSLGVILFELVAGRQPFTGEMGELIGQHLFQAPPVLAQVAPSCPPEISQLVDRLLRKDKDSRPSMESVRSELTGLLAKLGSGTSGVVPMPAQLDTSSTIIQYPVQQSTLGHSLGQAGVKSTPIRTISIYTLSVLFVLTSAWLARSAFIVKSQSTAAADFSAVSVASQHGVTSSTSLQSASGHTLDLSASPDLLSLPEVHKVKISSDPSGVAIMIAATGRMIGKTPLEYERSSDEEKLEIRASLNGYQDKLVTLDFISDNQFYLKLNPAIPKSLPQAKAIAPKTQGIVNSVIDSRLDFKSEKQLRKPEQPKNEDRVAPKEPSKTTPAPSTKSPKNLVSDDEVEKFN